MLAASERRLVLIAMCVSAAAALGAYVMSIKAPAEDGACRGATASMPAPDARDATPPEREPAFTPPPALDARPAMTVEHGKFVFDGTPQPEFDALSGDAMVGSVNAVLNQLSMPPVTRGPDRIATTTRFDEDRRIIVQWNDYNRFGALRVTAHDCAPTEAIRCIRSVEVQPRAKLAGSDRPYEQKHTRLSYLYCSTRPPIVRLDCGPNQRAPTMAQSLPVQTSGPEWTNEWMDSLRRVIYRRSNMIESCYERALEKDPDAVGEARFEITIDHRGRVWRVDTVSDIDQGSVATCASRSMKRWRFPRPDGQTSALIGFRFSTVSAHD